jgi:CDP-glucose 4,6-dehydratase
MELNLYKGKKVFVTGHTGFKGSWMLQLLKTIGVKVRGYSLTPQHLPNHYSLLNLDDNESVLGDLLDYEKLSSEIIDFQPDIVFHLAAQALVRLSYKNPLETYSTNVLGTLNLLNACRDCNNLKAVVCITTDKVYENREWHYPYRETDELGGYDLYSSSKACCEILIKSFRNSFFNLDAYNKDHSVLIASARAGNVIGGGDWSFDRLLPDLVKSASIKKEALIRNPNSIRPWQHVLDCLYGYLMLGNELLKGKSEFATSWNFAPYANESMTVSEVILEAQKVWADIEVVVESDSRFHETKLLRLDNSKSINELGWLPTWDARSAIKKTITWYKEYYLNNNICTQNDIISFLNAKEK